MEASFWVFARRLACRFGADQRGNIALIFGGLLLTLLTSVGAMVDYGRAYAVHGKLSATLDAALLATAADAVAADDNDDAKVTVSKSLSQLWTETHGVDVVKVMDVSVVNSTVTGQAAAKVPTTFLAAVGVDVIDVDVMSKINFGTGTLELALVLDVTRSMDGAKLDGLKSAADDLVEQLFDAAGKPEDVKISLVPFSHYVNVGMGNRNASWIDVPSDYSNTENVCSDSYPTIDGSCREVETSWFEDGQQKFGSTTQCDYDYSQPPTTTCEDRTTNYTWSGCVGSVGAPGNVQDVPGERVPGLLNTGCPAALVELTSSETQLTSAIAGLGTHGDTYIPAGLVWGWRSLSSAEPFSGGASASDKVAKVIVLMTDGENTRSASFPKHDGNDTAAANAVTQELCTNIKAEGIQLYTLTFDVTDSTVEDLMSDCASGPPFYHDASSVGELLSAFEDIGKSLIQLRIAG